MQTRRYLVTLGALSALSFSLVYSLSTVAVSSAMPSAPVSSPKEAMFYAIFNLPFPLVMGAFFGLLAAGSARSAIARADIPAHARAVHQGLLLLLHPSCGALLGAGFAAAMWLGWSKGWDTWPPVAVVAVIAGALSGLTNTYIVSLLGRDEAERA